MSAVRKERPPDEENGPALFGDSGRTELQLSRGNDKDQLSEAGAAEQAHDRALSLHSRLSDAGWLDGLGLPQGRAGRLEVRNRVLAEALAGGWISYGRNWNWWPPRRYLPYGLRLVRPEIDLLGECGLLEHDRRPPGPRGRQSRFCATPELYRLAEGIEPVYVRGETIVMRDAEGHSIDYVDTAETRAMRRRADALNEALTATDIDLDPGRSGCPARPCPADQRAPVAVYQPARPAPNVQSLELRPRWPILWRLSGRGCRN